MPTPEGQEYLDRYRLLGFTKMISRGHPHSVLIKGLLGWTNDFDEVEIRRCAKELSIVLYQPDMPAFAERFLARLQK